MAGTLVDAISEGMVGGGLGSGVMRPPTGGVQTAAPGTAAAPGAVTQSKGAAHLAKWLGLVKFERGMAIVPGAAPMSMAAFSDLVSRTARDYGVQGPELKSTLEGANLGFAMDGSGNVSISGVNTARPTPPDAAPGTGGGQTAAGAGGGGSSYGGVSAGGGGSGGGSYYRGAGTNGGWGGGSGESGGSVVTIGPGGVGGGQPFDPSKPLGIDPSKFAGGPVGGLPQFRSGTFPSAGNPFEKITKDSSAQDVAMALAQKQYANQQASLGIYGGLYDQYQSDPTLQGARGVAGSLAANPLSLDDATVSRIAGRSIDAIGQRAGRLEASAKDRAAASGTLRGGDTETRIGSIQSNAAKQATAVERDLQVQQALQRPQDLRAALGALGQFGAQDAAGRGGIAMGAADRVLGQTSILGDAMLTGALMGGGPPPMKVALGGPGYNLGPNIGYL